MHMAIGRQNDAGGPIIVISNIKLRSSLIVKEVIVHHFTSILLLA